MNMSMNDDIRNVQIIAELAKEVNTSDPIDWADLAISENESFNLIANQVYEQYKKTESIDNERLVLLATIVKLTVENFVLNLRLIKQVNQNHE